MNIAYLVSTHKENIEILVERIKKHIPFGDVVVCNQCADRENVEKILDKNRTIVLYNTKDKGVSKSRNFLLRNCTADYISFLDNDMGVNSNAEIIIAEEINKLKSPDEGLCFNIEKYEIEKNRSGYLAFKNLTNRGVNGCIFKRKFLIENNIFFDERIGPGTDISNGEDTVYLHCFLKKNRLYYCPKSIFHKYDSDIESTWQGEHLDYNKELYSRGYYYSIIFRYFAYLIYIFHSIKHYKTYNKYGNLSFLKILQLGFSGIRREKKEAKNNKRSSRTIK